jgi:8-oxo-dGTP pyrophosphatase MutT (NUDIX family)
MLIFHAVGDWSPTQVLAHSVPDTRRILPDVERLIDQTWSTVSSRPGVYLFDGPMSRLERWTGTADRLDLFLSTTSYKPFLGTNLYHPELADTYGRDVLANPVGVSPALETADGFLLFGRRNASVAYYPNRIHPFAGALEPNDAADVFAAVHRELAEELSLTPADVTDIRCTGVAEDLSIRQPELIFRVTTNKTRAQIESCVDRTEHHESFAVEASSDAIDHAIREHGATFTPVAIAALLLWARTRFGVEWYDHRVKSGRFRVEA